MTTPLFIFSLPRSGSTLLQRLLLASGDCATLGEPGLLLRFLDNRPHTQRLATYWESLLETSLDDIRKQWPEFDSTYRKGIRDLASSVYTGLSDGKRYFIDKTPRYSLIAEQILETFPDAKFILLWRHPAAVAVSLSNSYRDGVWALRDFEIDLFAGLDQLHAVANRHEDKILQIRYEDLVAAPKPELQKVASHLHIKTFEDISEKSLPPSTGGKLGDQTGRVKYSEITRTSLDQWQSSIDNWYRRRWLREYFSGERSSFLAALGYTLDEKLMQGPPNLIRGSLDCWHSMMRSNRRNRSPKSKKIERRYAQNTGHHITFR